MKADFKRGDLTGLNRGYFLSTKVQHETLSINCGEDCTQHFRAAYFSLLLVEGRVWLRQAAAAALKKNRKQPAQLCWMRDVEEQCTTWIRTFQNKLCKV